MERSNALTVAAYAPGAARESGGATPSGLTGLGRANLALGSLGFVLLTLGVFWYQFHRIHPSDISPHWSQLRWGYLVLILLALPLETVASALRIWLLCRVLQPGVRFGTCIQAEWANAAISILTPSQSGGGAGQVYMLSRGGASVGTALTISLLSFVGTMVGLLGLGLYSLAFSGIGHAGPLFTGAVASLAGISAAMLLAAVRPGAFRIALARTSRALWRLSGRARPLEAWWPPQDARTGPPVDRMDRWAARLADVLYTYRDDVLRFVRKGRITFVAVCGLSVAFLFSRALMPYLCVRFLGIGTSTFGEIIRAQMALIFLVFFAPTPGGAGLAEGASLSLMASVVPVGFAPSYNLLWRFSTAYLAAVAGLVCLARALLLDARRAVRRTPIEGGTSQ